MTFRFLTRFLEEKTLLEKVLLTCVLSICLIPILFTLWIVVGGFLYKPIALSNEMLLRVQWKYHDGNCKTDTYQLTKQQVQERDKHLALQYRWPNKSTIMTLKDGSSCSYISKGYYDEYWYSEKFGQ